jgi:putative transposase
MDGKGRWVDNVFIERFWWTLKYEELHLKRYETVRELETGLTEFIRWYNKERIHSSLSYKTPDEVYWGESVMYKKLWKFQLDGRFFEG